MKKVVISAKDNNTCERLRLLVEILFPEVDMYIFWKDDSPMEPRIEVKFDDR